MTASPRPTRQVVLAIVAIVLLVLAVHGVAVFHQFSPWDDAQLVTGNELLNPVTPAKLGRMWSGPVEGLYSPLAYTLWAAATVFDGTRSPAVFHAINLLLHAGCCVIVLRILLRLTGGRIAASAIGAAVFAVHPLQVEPVAWVSGMNNVLAALFSLAAILAYLKAVPWPPLPGGERDGVKAEPSHGSPRSKAAKRRTSLSSTLPAGAGTPRRWGGGGRTWYFIAVPLFLLACLSKPTAIVTPIILFAIDGLLLRRPLRSIVLSLLPFVAIAAVFVVVARQVQTSADIYQPALHHRLLIAADAVGFYLQKLALPWPLHVDYGRTPASVVAAGPSLWPMVALAVAVTTVVIFRRRRWVAASLAVFASAMSLVIGLVPFDFQAFSTVADRYAYMAMFGVAMAVAFGLTNERRALVAIAVLVVVVLGIMSVRQSLHWKTAESLAAHQQHYNPNSLGTHVLLADVAKLNRDDAAFEKHVQAILSLSPHDGRANLAMAELHFIGKRYADALPYYLAAYDAGQRSASMLNNMGLSYWKTNQLNPAADAFCEAVARNPDLFNAQLNCGLTLANLGRLDQAAFHLHRATQLDPTSTLARDSLTRVNAMRGIR